MSVSCFAGDSLVCAAWDLGQLLPFPIAKTNGSAIGPFLAAEYQDHLNMENYPWTRYWLGRMFLGGFDLPVTWLFAFKYLETSQKFSVLISTITVKSKQEQ